MQNWQKDLIAMAEKMGGKLRTGPQQPKPPTPAKPPAEKPVAPPDAIERFAVMVRRHDVAYDYSDDHSVWTRGQAERQAIMALYNSLDDERKAIAKEVWNLVMREKFKNPAEFFWK